MRNRFQRVNSIFHFIGSLLKILSPIVLLPLIVVFIYWGKKGDGWNTVIAFVIRIEKADIVVAAMGNDVDNLACAILAKSFDVPQVIVRMRDPAYENAYKLAGATSIVRVTDLMINEMMMEIEQPEVRRIMTIGGGRGEIFMVIVPQDAKAAGKSVENITKNSKFPSQCVFIAVYNQEAEEFYFPRGEHVINEGDSVFLISPTEDVKKAADFLTA